MPQRPKSLILYHFDQFGTPLWLWHVGSIWHSGTSKLWLWHSENFSTCEGVKLLFHNSAVYGYQNWCGWRLQEWAENWQNHANLGQWWHFGHVTWSIQHSDLWPVAMTNFQQNTGVHDVWLPNWLKWYSYECCGWWKFWHFPLGNAPSGLLWRFLSTMHSLSLSKIMELVAVHVPHISPWKNSDLNVVVVFGCGCDWNFPSCLFTQFFSLIMHFQN